MASVVSAVLQEGLLMRLLNCTTEAAHYTTLQKRVCCALPRASKNSVSEL